EQILHQMDGDTRDKLLILNQTDMTEATNPVLSRVRGHRAIGVVYNPAHERYGNYVPTVLPMRYDAFLFIDQTMALHPLHLKERGGEVPDTYPWGF
ncbi:MAG: erythromycin esterase family protein, partial [Phycisphaerales bacterium]|nr:erythromycin esterase family protein [Phycisphaerales bacterium]